MTTSTVRTCEFEIDSFYVLPVLILVSKELGRASFPQPPSSSERGLNLKQTHTHTFGGWMKFVMATFWWLINIQSIKNSIFLSTSHSFFGLESSSDKMYGQQAKQSSTIQHYNIDLLTPLTVMKMCITSTLLCAILVVVLVVNRAKAFEIPTNKKHLSPRLQHSSQKAVDAVVVDAIATGGSVVADAATVATSSIAPAAEALANSISSFSPQLLDTNIEETAATAATLEQLPSWVGLDSLDAAGATLGAGGFLAGTIITGIFGNGEARRLNGISKEQSKEIETLTANLAEMKAKQLEVGC